MVWAGTTLAYGKCARAALAMLTAAVLLTCLHVDAMAARKRKPLLETSIAYLSKQYQEPPPLSLLEKVLTDEGAQGARLGLKDNNVTGRLLGRIYKLAEHIVPADGDVTQAAKDLLSNGHKLIIADLKASDLLAVADLPEASDAVILNIRASDNRLRQDDCRANVFHISLSWAMRADALAQYLVWKKWYRWLLVAGKAAADEDYARSVRRAAKRFGGQIVEERSYKFEAGSRRVETGHQQIQTQMPLVTQGAPAHDVVFAIDTAERFAEYLLFRTYEPRPVVGTHGLVAVTWHRTFEQWGGMAYQNAFEKQAGRISTERDYNAWLAMRIFGEAVTRTGQDEPSKVRAYLLSDKFTVGGFKGQGLTFRRWNNQLRQPIPLAGPRALVSLSPQEGFLHHRFLTDSLGFDEPESKCRFSQLPDKTR